MNRLLAHLGATPDERISNLLSLVLCAVIPILFALATASASVPQ